MFVRLQAQLGGHLPAGLTQEQFNALGLNRKLIPQVRSRLICYVPAKYRHPNVPTVAYTHGRACAYCAL